MEKEKPNLPNAARSHSLLWADQLMVTLIKLSLLHYPEKAYSSVACSDKSTTELLIEGCGKDW